MAVARASLAQATILCSGLSSNFPQRSCGTRGPGTLNLVGWLSGTLSLFRQPQQLPMVSEQPAHPRRKRNEQVTVAPRSPAPAIHHRLCPADWKTRTLCQTIHPCPGQTLWLNINSSWMVLSVLVGGWTSLLRSIQLDLGKYAGL